MVLFDWYVVLQQLQIHAFDARQRHEELFDLISENAADMIAVVNADAHGPTSDCSVTFTKNCRA